jgi:hypothetical protein
MSMKTTVSSPRAKSPEHRHLELQALPPLPLYTSMVAHKPKGLIFTFTVNLYPAILNLNNRYRELVMVDHAF